MSSKSFTIFKDYTVEVSYISEKKDSYTEGYCPLCGENFQSTVHYGSSDAAILATKSKIMTHMKMRHKDLIIEDEKIDEKKAPKDETTE